MANDRIDAATADAQASQARLSFSVGIARLGLFEWDTGAGVVERNGTSRQIFGPSAEGPVQQDGVFARCEKIDVERAEALTEALGPHGTAVVADFRVRRRCVTTRAILSSSEP